VVTQSIRGAPGSRLFHYSISRRKLTPLGLSGTTPMLTDDGHLLYVDLNGTLYSVPFDADKGVMTAKPAPVATGVRVSGLRAHAAASRSGVIVFSPTVVSRDNELVIVDRAGHAVPLPVGAKNFRNPRFSPDGRRLVVNISRSEEVSNTGDVWTYDISSQRQSRLTFDDYSLSPAWTHDGRTIA